MNNRMNIEMIEDAPLTLQTRAALALNSTHTERELIALAAKNAHIVAVIDKPGRMQAHAAAMELKTARTTIQKVSKDAREDATAFQKAIIEEEKRLIGLVQPSETRLIGLRDAFDDEQERIRIEAENKERARITAIQERISVIRGYLLLAGQCRTAERILVLLTQVENIRQEGFDGFEEFAAEASTVTASTFDALVKLHAAKLAEEEDRARVRAEGEAAAARLAEQRKEQEAEVAKLADERAAFAAEQAEFKAAQAAAKAAAESIVRQEQEARDKAAYEDALNAAQVVDATIAPFKTLQEQIEEVTASPEMKKQFEKTYAYTQVAWNPTDMQIFDALCVHFNKSEKLVFERLIRGFDFVTLHASVFDGIEA